MIRKIWRALRRSLTLRNLDKARRTVKKYRDQLDRAIKKADELQRRYLEGDRR